MLSGLRDRVLLSSRRKAYSVYRNKPFDSEYLSIDFVLRLFKPILSIVSVVTGYVYLNEKLSSGGVLISTYSPIVILILLESLKYFLTPKMVCRILKGKYLEASIIALFVIPIYLLSIYFSINGVVEYFDIRKEVKIERVIDYKGEIEAIKSNTNKSVSLEQNKYSTISRNAELNNTLKWKTTTDQLSLIENRIDRLTEQSQKEIEAVRLEANSEIEATTEELSINIGFIRYSAIVTELLLLFCFIFNQYYMYRSYLGNIDFRKRRGK